MLLSLVRSLVISSGEPSITESTLVRLKSVVGIEVALKVGFARKDLAAAVSWAYMHHYECQTNIPGVRVLKANGTS